MKRHEILQTAKLPTSAFNFRRLLAQWTSDERSLVEPDTVGTEDKTRAKGSVLATNLIPSPFLIQVSRNSRYDCKSTQSDQSRNFVLNRILAVGEAVVSPIGPSAHSFPTDRLKESASDSSDFHRYEEFDVNFRDAHGTLWGVWLRLAAHRQFQTYFEKAKNFSPMFFSRTSPELIVLALPEFRLVSCAPW